MLPNTRVARIGRVETAFRSMQHRSTGPVIFVCMRRGRPSTEIFVKSANRCIWRPVGDVVEFWYSNSKFVVRVARRAHEQRRQRKSFRLWSCFGIVAASDCVEIYSQRPQRARAPRRGRAERRRQVITVLVGRVEPTDTALRVPYIRCRRAARESEGKSIIGNVHKYKPYSTWGA